MALTATIYRFNLDISDVDRGVYDTIELRVAMHPSESVSYLMTRILVWVLNHQEGLVFAKGGLSQSDDPPLFVDDLTGNRTHWFEIGHPSADRLHKAAKLAETVKVYVHKPLYPWLETMRTKGVHRAEFMEIVEVPAEFVEALGATLERNNRWTMVHTEGEFYVTVGQDTVQGTLGYHRLG